MVTLQAHLGYRPHINSSSNIRNNLRVGIPIVWPTISHSTRQFLLQSIQSDSPIEQDYTARGFCSLLFHPKLPVLTTSLHTSRKYFHLIEGCNPNPEFMLWHRLFRIRPPPRRQACRYILPPCLKMVGRSCRRLSAQLAMPNIIQPKYE